MSSKRPIGGQFSADARLTNKVSDNHGDDDDDEMPERDDRLCRSVDVDAEPGYDWMPGRFGPPPGIRRDRVRTIEALSDDEFFRGFLRWSPEEQQALMISERHRRRTFNCRGWPKTSPVDVDRLAAEGFFWTGESDRAQCAFCAGFLGNWETGDPPVAAQHRRFFPYCKRAQRKPCPNLPLASTAERKRADVGCRLVARPRRRRRARRTA